MKLLGPNMELIDTSQLTNDPNKNKFLILDCTDPENMDYYFPTMMMFNDYDYPAAHLKIGEYDIIIPMNWKIMTADPAAGDVELVDIEELAMFDYLVFAINPIYSFTPHYEPVEIINTYTSNIGWFVPMLKRSQFLGVPLGSKDKWPSWPDGQGGAKQGPLCVFFTDDQRKTVEMMNISDIF